jgi:hypothetical protein
MTAAKMYSGAVPKASLMPKSINSIGKYNEPIRGRGFSGSTPKAVKPSSKEPQRKTRRQGSSNSRRSEKTPNSSVSNSNGATPRQ